MPSGWENAPEYGDQGGPIRWVRVAFAAVVILGALVGAVIAANIGLGG